MSVDPQQTPEAVPELLAACAAPLLVGVRHHSPVLAAAVPAILEAADPDAVLVELPAEVQPWLPWLGHPDTVAPVALVLGTAGTGDHSSYPFADFSPELAAVRWARAHDVPVHAIDLPAAAAVPVPDIEPEPAPAPGRGPVEALLRAVGTDDGEELWDRLVEARSYGADPERIRRAALTLGWAHRAQEIARGGVGVRDRTREAWMRRRLAEIGAERPAAVIGSFHAAALLPGPPDDPALRHLRGREPDALPDPADVTVPEPGALPASGTVTALIPYTFALLDSRSGYPAGIRDPQWQQDVYEAAGDPGQVLRAAARSLAGIGAHLRADGHVSGVPDTAAAYRMARDLAAVRDLPAPGRRELVEGLSSALAQGEPLGRARALARAAEAELVGDRRGAPAPDAPVSGLVVHVAALLADLHLPGAGDEGRELRLDPLRPGRDRDRHIALHRLRAVGIAYAEPLEGGGTTPDGQTLGRRWSVRWTPATAATLELVSCYGTTLEQAARGRVTARLRRQDGDLTPAAAGEALLQAAECALTDLVADLGRRVEEEVLPRAGLADAVALHDRVLRVVEGQVPGMPRAPELLSRLRVRLAEAAVASVSGLSGSTDRADAVALLRVVRLVQDQATAPGAVGTQRLLWHLRRMTEDGGALARGAAVSARFLLEDLDAPALGAYLDGWLAAPPPAGGSAPAAGGAAQCLAGAMTVAAPVVEADPGILDAMTASVERAPDEDFLLRLPALREGFDALSAAARARFLAAVEERIGEVNGDLGMSPDKALALAEADTAARRAVDALLPGFLDGLAARPGAPRAEPPRAAPARTDPAETEPDASPHAIGAADRWRLVLGRPPRARSGRAHRAGAALDELYGRGHGEGSHAPRGGAAGGRERPEVAARAWADELQALFGPAVREEVLARAAARGRSDVLDRLDPDQVTPSVDLLESMLALAGALPESRLARLRPLVRRVTDQLVERLARRLRPALTGLATPRPTRRPGGRLDLGRTVRANLRTVRPGPDGPVLVPENPVFATRARRTADWHVHIVVDVSGSMERSTVYAALVAAVLHALPALSVSFTTFSTEVVDLTDRVSDPLALLLEVAVGGGTDIGAALAHTRSRIRVPSRSIVALVTDFEEGGSLPRTLGEVRALAGSGAHLLGLAALDDAGGPVCNQAVAGRFVAAGMPVASLSPLELASWIGEKVRG
ncbi:DUF5682 family protein [Nocardiopsis aegyptia]|uniref:DUF5682 family protein n=1 Tax=Nocardiopsis aegyptia TaxID=220378 RepID=UPI003670AD6F